MLEAAYWFALLSQEAPARREAKRVIQRWCLEGGRPLSALFSLSEGELRERLALSEGQARRLLAAGARAPQAEATLQTLAAQGVGLVTRDDLRYPEALPQRLPEEWLPYYFFFKGELALLTEPGMALLGGETSPPA
ncbi:MAG: hypothetical protein J7M05_04780, partial [Anaerolineae bacterium]|nr:hypothetical protein [Anaerolineae bacterium]